MPEWRPGARFSKVPIINGPVNLFWFTREVSVVLHLTWWNCERFEPRSHFKSKLSLIVRVKLSVNEIKWSSLLARNLDLLQVDILASGASLFWDFFESLARNRALILYISFRIFDFGPEKSPGLWRNGPQVWKRVWILGSGLKTDREWHFFCQK